MQAHMALANKHSTAQRNKAIKHASSTGIVTQAKSPHVLQGNNPTKRFSEEVCNIAFTTHAKHEDLLLLELVLDEAFFDFDTQPLTSGLAKLRATVRVYYSVPRRILDRSLRLPEDLVRAPLRDEARLPKAGDATFV